MCGINKFLAFKGIKNHKRKDKLLLISLVLSVVSVRDMIENSLANWKIGIAYITIILENIGICRKCTRGYISSTSCALAN